MATVSLPKASRASERGSVRGTPPEPTRDLRQDILGLGLIAATLMLLVSLVSRDPRDPITEPSWPLRLLYTPDSTHYPLNDTVTNACGYWGAYFSSMLIDAIGISVVLTLVGCGCWAFAILGRGMVRAPVLRSLGLTVMILAVSTAACLAPISPDGFPTVGAGGYLGAMGSEFLTSHFALPGAWILTVTVLIIGLLLTTDYALWYAGVKVLACGAMVSRRGFESVHGSLPLGSGDRSRKVLTDLDAVPGGGHAGGAAAKSSTVKDTNAAAGAAIKEMDSADDSGPYHEPTIKLRSRPKGSKSAASQDDASSRSDHKSDATDRADAKADGEDADVDADFGKVSTGVAPALAKLAAAVGLKSKRGRGADATDKDADDGVAPWEDADGDQASGQAARGASGVHRDLEVAGETLKLRQDESHEPPEPHDGQEPKIRVPKKREELQAVIDAVNEDLPDGVDEYRLPSVTLLDEADDICYADQTAEVRRKARILEETFRNFGFNIRVVEIETGPVIAQYEVELEAGLRLSKITGLADDLAIALRVPSVRIVAPIPGKNTVGIEVPNEQRQVVTLREVIEECGESTRKMSIPVFLGKDVSGNPLTIDLTKMPHLLIAGRTGTGKSVCLNAIITSVLMTCSPEQVRMLMIDPKMVELSGYARLPHLMHPVVTDMKKAEAILAWAVDKMEERYSLLAKAGVRHINSYNDLGREELCRRLEIDPGDDSGVPERLPFIVIVADEMADLMMTAGKEVETHIIRLAQKSRAVGIHLILATQKPTVDVITGLIKSNLPARLSFQVASRTDSRVVLDENGADKLLGNGDMLFLWPGTSTLIRGQGTYLSDAEIDRVVAHCSTGEQNFVGELMNLKVEPKDGDSTGGLPGNLKKRDELYESAIEVVIREGRGSVSLLQRCLGIGYGRAARLIDYMAEDGIVGEYNGSQAREVIISVADWERMQGLTAAADEPKPSPSRPNTTTYPKAADLDDRRDWDDDDEDSERDEDDD